MSRALPTAPPAVRAAAKAREAKAKTNTIHAIDQHGLNMAELVITDSKHFDSTIIMVDANAQVGSITSEAVGAADADQENKQGRAFHQFMINTQFLKNREAL